MHSHGAPRRVPIPDRIRRRGAPRVDADAAPDGAAGSSGSLPAAAAPEPGSPVGAGPASVDAAFALTRAEADALRDVLAPPDRRRDAGTPQTTVDRRWSVSPDSLRSGIEASLGTAGRDACVEVRRLPGALRTPEMWHVRLVGVAPDAAARIEAAVRLVRRPGDGDVR